MRNILDWNAEKVRNLSGAEIWLSILGRGLMALGVGAFLGIHYPQIANPLVIPTLVVGGVLFAIGLKGLWRKKAC
jgi:hypothetical protein